MNITVQRFAPEKNSTDATVVLVPQNEDLFGAVAAKLPEVWSNAGSLFESGDFKGGRDSSAVIYTGSKKSPRLILVGLGELGETTNPSVTLERIRRAASVGAQKAVGMKCSRVSFLMPSVPGASETETAQAVVEGAGLGTYSFDKYFTSEEASRKTKLDKLSIQVEEGGNQKAVREGANIGLGYVNGAVLARDLANAPSNEIYPEALAGRAKELSKLGVKVTVFDKKKIERLGMGGLLAVNQGSEKPPFFIIMEWNGGKRNDAPIVLVGKGITFDSGGISLKPGAGMGDMKMDMGGSAAVIGAMRGIAELKVPANVIALVPTTENMPSGTAYKPGDVITHMNGKTSEIDNTDAEGRLILADALTYADRYKPKAVIDLATLTGACVIALGYYSAGLFGNNQHLLSQLKKAGDNVYERMVELPLYEEYEEQIKSDIADVKNTGGRPAGAITAALFLQNFIGDYPWAHIDIAGISMTPKSYGYVNKGGNGAGARVLIDMVRHWED